jgi:ketosteroid isomerase-like protein
MNLRLHLLVTCLLIVGITGGFCQNQEIETTIGNLNTAMISKDKSALDKLTSDDLSYGHSTNVIQDKSSFMKDVLSGPTVFQKIDITNQTIHVTGDIAVVRNVNSITGTTGGAPLDIKIGVLMIWKKQEGTWKLLARQGFKLPQN